MNLKNTLYNIYANICWIFNQQVKHAFLKENIHIPVNIDKIKAVFNLLKCQAL